VHNKINEEVNTVCTREPDGTDIDVCNLNDQEYYNYIVSLEDQSQDCKGEMHSYYYGFLLFSHIYFLLEFMLRVSVQKYQYKFLMTLDSFLEILTTVPFLICISFFGT
jgi:hypothetical protein